MNNFIKKNQVQVFGPYSEEQKNLTHPHEGHLAWDTALKVETLCRDIRDNKALDEKQKIQEFAKQCRALVRDAARLGQRDAFLQEFDELLRDVPECFCYVRDKMDTSSVRVTYKKYDPNVGWEEASTLAIFAVLVLHDLKIFQIFFEELNLLRQLSSKTAHKRILFLSNLPISTEEFIDLNFVQLYDSNVTGPMIASTIEEMALHAPRFMIEKIDWLENTDAMITAHLAILFTEPKDDKDRGATPIWIYFMMLFMNEPTVNFDFCLEYDPGKKGKYSNVTTFLYERFRDESAWRNVKVIARTNWADTGLDAKDRFPIWYGSKETMAKIIASGLKIILKSGLNDMYGVEVLPTSPIRFWEDAQARKKSS